MRIQLRLNEVGLGRMSVMFCYRGLQCSRNCSVQMLQMIRMLQWRDQKVANQWLWGYLPLTDCCVSRNVEAQVVSELVCVYVWSREWERQGKVGHMYMCSDISNAMKGSQLERSPLDLTCSVYIREKRAGRVQLRYCSDSGFHSLLCLLACPLGCIGQSMGLTT